MVSGARTDGLPGERRDPEIMLIDDDEGMHTLVRRIVQGAGYRFCGAYGGEDGLALLRDEKPDLLLLDVMMPGMNGFDVCESIRQEGRFVPIVFLSAKSDIVDKSIGYRAGADDYVVKPFDPDELLLRIDALMRRHEGELTLSRAEANRTRKIGDLEILMNKYEVRVNGANANLTAKEFEILALLASNPGQVFTRSQIYETLWGAESDADENSITVFIRKIREKIEENPSQPRYLLTVWRVGYKLAEE